MKSITSTWFEVKADVLKTLENGSEKKVSEQYVCDAMSFSEAENKITEELSPYDNEFAISAIKIAKYREVFFSDDAEDDKFFKVKVNIITLDEKTCKEKKTAMYFLFQASTAEKAIAYTNEAMSTSISDYNIDSVQDSSTLDVFVHEGFRG